MRIAYIINSLDGYGAGLPVPMVMGVMRDLGTDVRLFALSRRDGRMEQRLAAAGIAFESCPGGGPLASLGWLRRALAAYAPTLLWTSLTHATLAGQLMGALLQVPVVSWQHNVFLKPGNIAALWLTRGLTRLWIADSEAVARVTRRRFGLAARDVATWPLFAADPAAPRARAAAPGEVFRIGSLGRLHPHKGYDVLVHALARIQREHPALSARFTVAVGGDGPARADIAALARRLGVANLVLAGYQEDPRAFLAAQHAYVQPSRVEGLCISAHEAMQAGLAAVVSAVGQMPLSVREGETGFVVPPGRADRLAAALVRLVSDPVRAAAMGAAARAQVNDVFSRARFHAAGQAALTAAALLPRGKKNGTGLRPVPSHTAR